MTTPELVLHHFPGACSRVTVCALEWAGLAYELQLVNIAKGEQTGKTYSTISALGKVPMMMVDGEPLLENSAILTLIHALRPEAGLFPADQSPRVRAEGVGGMSFCAGTLHPIVRGLANPQRLTVGDGEPVREKSRELAAKALGYAEARLQARGWWLGEISIVDVYLDWAFSVARKSGLDVKAWPRLDALEQQLASELPAYRRMQDEESQSRAQLGI